MTFVCKTEGHFVKMSVWCVISLSFFFSEPFGSGYLSHTSVLVLSGSDSQDNTEGIWEVEGPAAWERGMKGYYKVWSSAHNF